MPDETNTPVNPASAATPTLPTVAVPDTPGPDTVTPNAPTDTPAGTTAATGATSPIVEPEMPAPVEKSEANDTETPAEVARKIGESHNVLIALSSDPSVDEMAAAIGLSLYLDKLGKRATAIYSGQTPNALQFLKPEETFEASVDTLQDFVIALNKDKADHLRYKLDGDYVKIYITPYKSKIAEEDLEFSYGDYNVDLVLALDVANGVDLDSALREHGRIMHDAVIINITTGNPGKLGEIEWSDKSASSVSEMIAKLLYSVNSKAKIEKEEATAFLTGIVAATNRFSNAGTTPETMKLASRLMESGANQQLVSKNITPDVENEMFGMMSMGEAVSQDSDPTLLDIEHGNEKGVDESKIVDGTVTEKESSLLDDLKAAEASLAAAGAETTPENSNEPLKIDSEMETGSLPEVAEAVKREADHDADVLSGKTMNDEPVKVEDKESADVANVGDDSADKNDTPSNTDDKKEGLDSGILTDEGASKENPSGDFVSNKPEKVIEPPSEMSEPGFMNGGDSNKYGQMLEDALAGADVAPASDGGAGAAMATNPAVGSASQVQVNPEINGVPEINYMPMPGEEVLPPPPTPPIAAAENLAPASDNVLNAADAVSTMNLPVEPIQPAAPVAEPVSEPLGAQPAMQDQIYNAPVNDPSAFKIPGM